MLHTRRFSATGGLARGALLMLALAGALGACATKPVAEFAAYRESFNAAREAGEAVLLDYSSAKQVFAELREADPSGAAEDPERQFDFDAASILAEGDAPDDVTVRFRAWQVVTEYNEALTALIEGRSKAEMSAAVGGLLDSLRSFPIGALADAAGGLTPFGGLITTVLDQVQKAYEAEQFREAVLAGSELIPGFVALCIADTRNFYNVRRGLRDMERDPVVDAIASDMRLFRGAIVGISGQGGGGSGETIGGLAGRFNEILVEVRAENQNVGAGLGEDALAVEPGPADAAALGVILDRARERADRANALDAQLLAYREVLVAYVRMLQGLEAATGTLRAAAERRVFTLAPAEEIFRAALATRRALATYEEVGSK